MSKALLLALLLPVAQEEPQVTYREGLFEEVDQGNLEKAVELYAKVLKGDAPDALKARALFRTGACHEKKGKKKEAEQAWRDVIERYPGAAETVKLARGRLSRPEGETSSRSQEEQIQAQIFNLGSATLKTRQEAMRTLELLGDVAVPHLRRALQHRDRTLSNYAALVLCNMGMTEGVYESLRRFWLPQGDPSNEDMSMLPRLLREGSEDYVKFGRDFEGFRKTGRMHLLAPLLCSLPDPKFATIVEDWIVEGKGEALGQVIEAWGKNRPPSEFLRVMKRMAAPTSPMNYGILLLFYQHAGSVKEPDQELKAETLAALTRSPGSEDYFDHLHILAPYCGVSALVRGPLAAWFSRGSPEERQRLIGHIVDLKQFEDQKTLSAECRKLLFEQMASDQVPLATKELIVASGFYPDTLEERGKYLAFCLQFWKEHGAHRDEKQRTMSKVVDMLAFYLPPDAKELPAILDAGLDMGRVTLGVWGEHPDERQPLVVAAALRFMSRNADSRAELLKWFEENGSPREKLLLGALVPSFGETEVGGRAALFYADGFRLLPDAQREAHWKDLKARFAAAPAGIKARIADGLVGTPHARVDDLMKELSGSENEDLRHAAIHHWIRRDVPEQFGFVIQALQKPSDPVQSLAIDFLRSRPSLDAVPALIKVLDSASHEVRKAATAALNEIKKHFEAQAEWQRWYDEIKKTLKK